MPCVQTAAHIRAPGSPVNTTPVRVSSWIWCNGMRGECRIAAGGLSACERIKHLHVCWMRHRPGETVAPVSRSPTAVSRGDLHSVAPQQEPHGPPFLFLMVSVKQLQCSLTREISLSNILKRFDARAHHTVQECQLSSCFGFLGFLLLLVLSHIHEPAQWNSSCGHVNCRCITVMVMTWLTDEGRMLIGCNHSLYVGCQCLDYEWSHFLHLVLLCCLRWSIENSNVQKHVITTHNEPIHRARKTALVWTKHL